MFTTLHIWKNQIKNQPNQTKPNHTKPNQVRTITTTISLTIINNGKDAQEFSDYWNWWELFTWWWWLVTWWKKNAHNQTHKEKSKQKDCWFVCLFVCLCGGGDVFTFGTIYIHHHCYPPISPTQVQSITKKNSKVKVPPQSSASQREEGIN